MTKATGLKRIINAAKYSMLGFKSAIRHETAFRQEFIGLVLAVVLVFLIDFTIFERILLLLSVIFVMIVELINSAIECVVDRISREQHELSGRAKDYGSAAVFLAIVIVITIWGYIFINHFLF